MGLMDDSYHFENVGDFLKNKGKIEPFKKPTIMRFGEKYKMAGLSYVRFSNRISFNVNNGMADISDMSGNFPLVLNTIVSDSGFRHGLHEDELLALRDMKHATFGQLICLYKEKFPGLVIAQYNFYDAPHLDRFNSQGFNLPKPFGFT